MIILTRHLLLSLLAAQASSKSRDLAQMMMSGARDGRTLQTRKKLTNQATKEPKNLVIKGVKKEAQKRI